MLPFIKIPFFVHWLKCCATDEVNVTQEHVRASQNAAENVAFLGGWTFSCNLCTFLLKLFGPPTMAASILGGFQGMGGGSGGRVMQIIQNKIVRKGAPKMDCKYKFMKLEELSSSEIQLSFLVNLVFELHSSSFWNLKLH